MPLYSKQRALILFTNVTLRKVNTDNPENTYIENRAIVKQMWNDLSPAQMTEWIREANEDTVC